MPYRASQDTQFIGAFGELTAAEELRVQELQALSDTEADEALGKLSGSVVKKEITEGGNYTLPTATDSILGGVKVGSGLSITEGVLAVTGGSMVYPGAGIPLSTGEAWGTSITNNSANWNTAYDWGNHASAGYVTGTPWTALGYLTSLSGAVLTDQSTPQTIGVTGSRLAMLWATNITVTNAIDGSITGNAGTVTDGIYTTSQITALAAAEGDKGKYLHANASTGALEWATIAGGGDVSSVSDLTDNSIVRGDGGVKGVQTSTATIDDDGNFVLNGQLKIIKDSTRAVIISSDGTDTAAGAFVINSEADGNNSFGVYDADNTIYYGISKSLPSPSGWSTLGGYYSGLGIGGSVTSHTPIFGVLNSAQSDNGLGSTALTIYGDNVITSYHNTLNDATGRVGIGIAPTANITIKAGTASAGTAPLKFTSGVVNTTPEAGALEWNGTDLFITI